MTSTAEGTRFSTRRIPFSTSGSWLDLSQVIGADVVADDVHLVSHQTGFHPVLKLVPQLAGRRADAVVEGTPERLRWSHPAGNRRTGNQRTGWIEAAWERPDVLRIAGHGLGLALLAADPVLTPFTGPYLFADPVSGAHVLTLYQTGRRYRITALAGTQVSATGDQVLGAAERGVTVAGGPDRWEVAVEELDVARPPYRQTATFAEVVDAARLAFERFLDAVAPWRDDATPAAALAAYVLWSATVSPAGYLTRPAVLMSKHWMDKVWSWDHCFNALALAGLPQLAWDQFLVPFDHQDGAGGLPDSVAHSEVLRNFVKPPIHGWALGRLRRRAGDVDAQLLADVHRRLAAWTRFWLDARRAPGRELAHYQHGNDSGWDNATTFDPERVVESADLAAFLVLQLHQLAVLAAELGDRQQAAEWERTADRMRAALLAELWDGDRFVARGAGSGVTWGSRSLLDLMPVVLGEHLPAGMSDLLAARVEEHLTEHGLATEHPGSPDYRPDGYWRGPIWAPSTVLIEDGLRRAGHTRLADEISRRFRALCERSGFAENFDARTGAGQRDRAYTWTASAYLLLAADHQARRPG